jgi:hypothetical protein
MEAVAPQRDSYWGLLAENAVPKLAWVAAKKKQHLSILLYYLLWVEFVN